MDGLALLCNLHADGPLTLRRLRRAGIRTLVEVERAPRESLAGLLQTSGHHARRFLVEAQLLRRRLEDVPDEGAVRPSAPGAVPAAARPALPVRPAVQAFALRPAAGDATEAPEPRPAPDGAAVAPTVERSGDPFRSAPAVAATATEAPPRRAAEERDREEREPARVSEAASERPRIVASVVPAQAPRSPAAPPAGTEGTALKAGQIRGLDAALVERLVAQGVRTYRSLIELASLPLARRAEIPYTRLLDLRYHARRFLERRLFPDGRLSESVREVVLVPSPPPQQPTVPRTAAAAPGPLVTEGIPAPVGHVVPPPPATPPEPPGVAGPFV